MTTATPPARLAAVNGRRLAWAAGVAGSNEVLDTPGAVRIIRRAVKPRALRLVHGGTPMATPRTRDPAAPAHTDAAAAAHRGLRDAELAAELQRAAGGDAEAFERFYDRTFAYARTLARRMLRGAEVEDLLADVYFEAWRQAARFDPGRGSAVTWLLTLLRSRALDALRADAARPQASAGVAADDGEDGTAELPDPRGDPADQLWQREGSAQLQQALAHLSAAERWVLGLAYLREMSHAEIAAATGMPLGTVKSHVQRGQGRLRELLAPSLRAASGGLRAGRAS